jgi:hypothetical protein
MKNTYETPLSADLISTVKSIVEGAATNPLVPYKKKAVQGLHSYTHFEAPSGAFIQVRDGSGPEHYVHQDSKGNRKTFSNIDALKKHVASTKED